MEVESSSSCYFCLNTFEAGQFAVLEKVKKDMLEVVCSELDISLFNNITICSSCDGLLEMLFNFKSSCMDNEDNLFNFVKPGGRKKLDLTDIVKHNIKLKSKESILLTQQGLSDEQWDAIVDEYVTKQNIKVCRICLAVLSSTEIDEDNLINENRTLRVSARRCLPEVDLAITKDPIFCPKCIQNIEKHTNFISLCLLAQKKIVGNTNTKSTKRKKRGYPYDNDDDDSDFDVSKAELSEISDELEEGEVRVKCQYCFYSSYIKDDLKKHVQKRHYRERAKGLRAKRRKVDKCVAETPQINYEQDCEPVVKSQSSSGTNVAQSKSYQDNKDENVNLPPLKYIIQRSSESNQHRIMSSDKPKGGLGRDSAIQKAWENFRLAGSHGHSPSKLVRNPANLSRMVKTQMDQRESQNSNYGKETVTHSSTSQNSMPVDVNIVHNIHFHVNSVPTSVVNKITKSDLRLRSFRHKPTSQDILNNSNSTITSPADKSFTDMPSTSYTYNSKSILPQNGTMEKPNLPLNLSLQDRDVNRSNTCKAIDTNTPVIVGISEIVNKPSFECDNLVRNYKLLGDVLQNLHTEGKRDKSSNVKKRPQSRESNNSLKGINRPLVKVTAPSSSSNVENLQPHYSLAQHLKMSEQSLNNTKNWSAVNTSSGGTLETSQNNLDIEVNSSNFQPFRNMLRAATQPPQTESQHLTLSKLLKTVEQLDKINTSLVVFTEAPETCKNNSQTLDVEPSTSKASSNFQPFRTQTQTGPYLFTLSELLKSAPTLDKVKTSSVVITEVSETIENNSEILDVEPAAQPQKIPQHLEMSELQKTTINTPLPDIIEVPAEAEPDNLEISQLDIVNTSSVMTKFPAEVSSEILNVVETRTSEDTSKTQIEFELINTSKSVSEDAQTDLVGIVDTNEPPSPKTSEVYGVFELLQSKPLIENGKVDDPVAKRNNTEGQESDTEVSNVITDYSVSFDNELGTQNEVHNEYPVSDNSVACNELEQPDALRGTNEVNTEQSLSTDCIVSDKGERNLNSDCESQMKFEVDQTDLKFEEESNYVQKASSVDEKIEERSNSLQKTREVNEDAAGSDSGGSLDKNEDSADKNRADRPMIRKQQARREQGFKMKREFLRRYSDADNTSVTQEIERCSVVDSDHSSAKHSDSSNDVPLLRSEDGSGSSGACSRRKQKNESQCFPFNKTEVEKFKSLFAIQDKTWKLPTKPSNSPDKLEVMEEMLNHKRSGSPVPESHKKCKTPGKSPSPRKRIGPPRNAKVRKNIFNNNNKITNHFKRIEKKFKPSTTSSTDSSECEVIEENSSPVKFSLDSVRNYFTSDETLEDTVLKSMATETQNSSNAKPKVLGHPVFESDSNKKVSTVGSTTVSAAIDDDSDDDVIFVGTCDRLNAQVNKVTEPEACNTDRVNKVIDIEASNPALNRNAELGVCNSESQSTTNACNPADKNMSSVPNIVVNRDIELGACIPYSQHTGDVPNTNTVVNRNTELDATNSDNKGASDVPNIVPNREIELEACNPDNENSSGVPNIAVELEACSPKDKNTGIEACFPGSKNTSEEPSTVLNIETQLEACNPDNTNTTDMSAMDLNTEIELEACGSDNKNTSEEPSTVLTIDTQLQACNPDNTNTSDMSAMDLNTEIELEACSSGNKNTSEEPSTVLNRGTHLETCNPSNMVLTRDMELEVSGGVIEIEACNSANINASINPDSELNNPAASGGDLDRGLEIPDGATEGVGLDGGGQMLGSCLSDSDRNAETSITVEQCLFPIPFTSSSDINIDNSICKISGVFSGVCDALMDGNGLGNVVPLDEKGNKEQVDHNQELKNAVRELLNVSDEKEMLLVDDDPEQMVIMNDEFEEWVELNENPASNCSIENDGTEEPVNQNTNSDNSNIENLNVQNTTNEVQVPSYPKIAEDLSKKAPISSFTSNFGQNLDSEGQQSNRSNSHYLELELQKAQPQKSTGETSNTLEIQESNASNTLIGRIQQTTEANNSNSETSKGSTSVIIESDSDSDCEIVCVNDEERRIDFEAVIDKFITPIQGVREECSKCGFVTSNKELFTLHMANHLLTNGCLYSCPLCSYNTQLYLTYMTHINSCKGGSNGSVTPNLRRTELLVPPDSRQQDLNCDQCCYKTKNSNTAVISREDLRKEIAAVLKDSRVASISVKKVRQDLEEKFHIKLHSRKREIEDLVFECVRSKKKGAEEVKMKNKCGRPPKITVAQKVGEAWKQKKKRVAKPLKLSPSLAALVGSENMSRGEVVQKISSIIKERNLFDPYNKQYIICDDDLLKVIGVKRFRALGMMREEYEEHKIKHYIGQCSSNADNARRINCTLCSHKSTSFYEHEQHLNWHYLQSHRPV